MKVLFICTANICRSPMAEAYMRSRLGPEGLHHVLVDSAGLLGIEGAPSPPEALQVVREAGADLTWHRSRGLRAHDLRHADWVLAMTRDHLDALNRREPVGSERRLLLRAFERGPEPAPDALDLEDPIGQSLEVYQRQFAIIRRSVDHLILHLKHGSRSL